MRRISIPGNTDSSRMHFCPGDLTIAGCVVILLVMGAFCLTGRAEAPTPPQNTIQAPVSAGSDLLTGSDNPDDNEAGAQDEPELAELRKSTAAEGNAPAHPRAAAPRPARGRR